MENESVLFFFSFLLISRYLFLVSLWYLWSFIYSFNYYYYYYFFHSFVFNCIYPNRKNIIRTNWCDFFSFQRSNLYDDSLTAAYSYKSSHYATRSSPKVQFSNTSLLNGILFCDRRPVNASSVEKKFRFDEMGLILPFFLPT